MTSGARSGRRSAQRDVGASGKRLMLEAWLRHDTPDGRRAQTLRDGRICADPGASRLVRIPDTRFAGPFDLDTNPPRQNDSS